MRSATYGVNTLNQYTNRSVPSAIDAFGTAASNATVTLNLQPTYRHGDVYRAEVPITNTSTAAWQSISNVAVLNNGTNADTISMTTGNVFLPKSSENFTNDADGNLISDGRWLYTWDGENRLVRMTCLTNIPTAAKLRLTFNYDWQGRRIMKSTEGFNGTSWSTTLSNRFVYDGRNLTAELNATNNSSVRTYVWGLDLSGSLQGAGGVGGLLIESFYSSPTTYSFVSYDGSGNIISLVNPTDGTFLAQDEYGPFGEMVKETGPMSKINSYRFSTKYQDIETEACYYGSRYYSPSIGRWASSDYSENGGLDLYAFVDNTPVNEIDLMGRDGWWLSPGDPPPRDMWPRPNFPGYVPLPGDDPSQNYNYDPLNGTIDYRISVKCCDGNTHYLSGGVHDGHEILRLLGGISPACCIQQFLISAHHPDNAGPISGFKNGKRKTGRHTLSPDAIDFPVFLGVMKKAPWCKSGINIDLKFCFSAAAAEIISGSLGDQGDSGSVKGSSGESFYCNFLNWDLPLGRTEEPYPSGPQLQ